MSTAIRRMSRTVMPPSFRTPSLGAGRPGGDNPTPIRGPPCVRAGRALAWSHVRDRRPAPGIRAARQPPPASTVPARRIGLLAHLGAIAQLAAMGLAGTAIFSLLLLLLSLGRRPPARSVRGAVPRRVRLRDVGHRVARVRPGRRPLRVRPARADGAPQRPARVLRMAADALAAVHRRPHVARRRFGRRSRRSSGSSCCRSSAPCPPA
jgi:hypothetical protein